MQNSLAHWPPATIHTKELKRNIVLPCTSGRPSKETQFTPTTLTTLLISVSCLSFMALSRASDSVKPTDLVPLLSQPGSIYSIFQLPSHYSFSPSPASSCLSSPLPPTAHTPRSSPSQPDSSMLLSWAWDRPAKPALLWQPGVGEINESSSIVEGCPASNGQCRMGLTTELCSLPTG